MASYRRVAYEDRCQIQAFLQQKTRASKIATALGFHKSTIYREIQRSKHAKSYQAKQAQETASLRFLNCRRLYGVSLDQHRLIRNCLARYWSPQMISERFRLEGVSSLSHQTIYNHIYRNWEELGPYLSRFNRRGGGRNQQRYGRLRSRFRSIYERPISAKNRSRFGHWERDTMEGPGRKNDLLLVCTERKSRYTRLGKTTLHTKVTSMVTNKLLAFSPKKVLSVTNDRGPEFRDGPNMKLPIFYCLPQKPQQRGTVENTIGVIRRRLPRKTSLRDLSHQRLKALEKSLNLRPMKCLDYRTPYEVLYKKKVALVF